MPEYWHAPWYVTPSVSLVSVVFVFRVLAMDSPPLSPILVPGVEKKKNLDVKKTEKRNV